MLCPYLIVHGGHDVLTSLPRARPTICERLTVSTFTLRIVDLRNRANIVSTIPDIGQALLSDWLAYRFRIDQRTC